jgi:hypothetical protein
MCNLQRAGRLPAAGNPRSRRASVHAQVSCLPADREQAGTFAVRQSDGLLCSRRSALLAAGLSLSLVGQQPWEACALPLAPLGTVQRVGGDKLTGLTDDEVKVRVRPTPLNCNVCNCLNRGHRCDWNDAGLRLVLHKCRKFWLPISRSACTL